MSCCCCWEGPSGELLDGVRRKELLLRREEEEQEEQEESRRNMDISLLREQYRSTREAQRRRTQVLLLRTVSEDLSEAVSVVPVAQGSTSPWEPNSSWPPAVTFDPGPAACDPWHLHLGLHRRRRRRPGVTAQLAASSPETNTNSSSRRSSFSSESVDRNLSVDSASPCSSSCSTTEEEEPPVPERPTGGPDQSQSPSEGSTEERPAGSDESSTPVASASGSPSCSTANLQEAAACGAGFRKFSAPALRVTRQLSVGGVGSSTGGPHNQNYHPFPNRKAPRISEAARRLGMYSSV